MFLWQRNAIQHNASEPGAFEVTSKAPILISAEEENFLSAYELYTLFRFGVIRDSLAVPPIILPLF
jgi:hypothetical protein